MAGSGMKHRSETLKNNRYDPSPKNGVSGITTVIMVIYHFPLVLQVKYFHEDRLCGQKNEFTNSQVSTTLLLQVDQCHV